MFYRLYLGIKSGKPEYMSVPLKYLFVIPATASVETFGASVSDPMRCPIKGFCLWVSISTCNAAVGLGSVMDAAFMNIMKWNF